MCVVYFGQCWRLAECWPCLWRNCAVLVSSGILRPFWNWAIRPVQVWTAGSLLPLRWLSDGSTLTVTTWFTFRASGSFCKCIHLQKKSLKILDGMHKTTGKRRRVWMFHELLIPLQAHPVQWKFDFAAFPIGFLSARRAPECVPLRCHQYVRFDRQPLDRRQNRSEN